MTSTPEPSLASKATATPDKIRSALLRYRVMAWITGLWLLLLVTEVVLKVISGGWNAWDTGIHVVGRGPADALSFVPVVHGWVYVVYLLMAVDLAIKVRWPAKKTIFTLLAGTIPFLSFYVEHIRTREIKSEFAV
ncbi:DUF3817 domain-containing protein [Williamsia maris]|uniref:Integral membrane protein n=1 Tax=Williamsia maris TaxID=72806 RepID=A0ABT1HL99_9NOCA|nr:DUF3817 domain-containing protein [Williamsia maris]MCP2178716.1 integral membrane protein [Williamsia maris]